MSDAELQKVEAALDALLADNDPSSQGYEEFRGHQFDHGLAWVMYPEGHGGLGVRPQLQKHANQRLSDAGAPSGLPSPGAAAARRSHAHRGPPPPVDPSPAQATASGAGSGPAGGAGWTQTGGQG